MAYTSCAANIAANIAQDCASPLVNGFTGRGVMINLSDAPTLTRSVANPRIFSAVTLGTGVKVCVVDNTGYTQPMVGTTVQSTDNGGKVQYQKDVVVRIPLRGADSSKDVVEPLNSSALGFLLILEKKDKKGDGSFVMIGAEQGLKANADGIVRNEYENGGDVVATMSTVENHFENVLFDTDYETTLAAFNAFIAKAM